MECLSFIRLNISDDDRTLAHYNPLDDTRAFVSEKISIANPDQRITQDADSVCRSVSNIIPLILMYRTWQVTGYYGPLGIFIYFILWMGINKIFISAVSFTIFQQDSLEEDFRFLHTQIRVFNETIAFYNGGTFEQTRFNHYFTKILSPILYRRTSRECFLNLSNNLYHYIGSIVTYLLLALIIFAFHFYDHLPSGELASKISEISFIGGYVIYRFNNLNDLTDEITLTAAHAHRVQSFVEYRYSIAIKSTE